MRVIDATNYLDCLDLEYSYEVSGGAPSMAARVLDLRQI